MIFLVLGTQKFQLNRLLMQVDEYVSAGEIQTEICAQIGCSDYEPQNFKFFRFMETQAFETYMDEAELIITHGGVGTILSAIAKKKPVIVFPRLAKYKEHVDDHQVEMARTFEKKGYVLYCREEDSLPELIRQSASHAFRAYVSETENIVGIINDFIDSH